MTYGNRTDSDQAHTETLADLFGDGAGDDGGFTAVSDLCRGCARVKKEANVRLNKLAPLLLYLKFEKTRKAVLAIKNKLMWSSLLRGQIQTYLPTALLTLGTFKSFYGKANEVPEPEEESTPEEEEEEWDE